MFAKSIIARAPRRVKWIVVPVLLVGIGGLAQLYQQVDARARVDGARHADAIIVLGSAVWANERPSPAMRARTQHAIGLYQAGFAPYVILAGGVGKFPPSEAEVMRRLAASAGVPAEALLLEDQSRSTEENLANAQTLMAQHGLQTAIIVSDPFHLYRAELIAHNLGMEATGSGARNSPMYTLWFNRVWYTTRETFALVWYSVTRVTGEPAWLYGILKGKF